IHSYTLSLHDALPIYSSSWSELVLLYRNGNCNWLFCYRFDVYYSYSESSYRCWSRYSSLRGATYYREWFRRGKLCLANSNSGWRSEEHTSELQSRENL